MSRLRELAASVPASALALTLDVSVMQALIVVCHWHYLLGASAGFTAGVALSYALSVRFIFRHRRLESRAHEFTVFALVGVAGLAINAGVIAFIVEVLHQHYLVGKAVAASSTFLFNFLIRRQLLFTPRAHRPPGSIEA